MTVERALREAGISVEVREYPLMYKETEVFVDTSKHDEEIRAKFAEWLEDNGYLHIIEVDYTTMKFSTKSRSVDAKTVIERYESLHDEEEEENYEK